MSKVGLIKGFTPLSTRQSDKDLISKISKKATVSVGGSNTLQGKFAQIKANVDSYLKLIKGETYAIRDKEELFRYLDTCIKNGIISIDTETTGLDQLEDKIIGICIYTPNEKAAYIPLLHESYISGNMLSNQLDKETIIEFFNKVNESKIKVIMFNAKFDLRMIHTNFGMYLTCYWDAMIASKLIASDLKKHTLKEQYRLRICPSMKKYNFDSLFSGVKNETIPIDTFTPYAAGDAIETYQLYEWQVKRLEEEPCILNVLMNIEMPLLPVVCEMEDRGVNFDFKKAKELSEKYHKKADDAEKEAQLEVSKFKTNIDEYNNKINFDIRKFRELITKTSDLKKQKEFTKNIEDLKKNIIPYPINFSSPKQLSILFYDILGYKPANTKEPRGTGEEVLVKNNTSLTKAILKIRKYEKLLSTYIDKMPLVVNKRDHRLHASFNQVGTDTGRFSSNEPNLQNIPARGEGVETREMFTATDGYMMFSSDFSQQEPRITAGMSGDESMINYYQAGNSDLYAYIASVALHKNYDDCREFYPEGTKVYLDGDHYLKAIGNEPNIEISTGKDPYINKEGKKLRKHFKAILLGICYGKGVASVAEDLGMTEDEAQNLFDTFFEKFPKIKEFMDKSQNMARKYGYVETVMGRRRRIPAMTLPEYDFESIGNKPVDFNPLDFMNANNNLGISEEEKEKYRKLLKNAKYYKEKQKIKSELEENGIKIIDNTKKISDATRQCLNSRVQGSAGDQAKLAMIEAYNNPRLRELGFHMLIPVHDEVVCECPVENVEECSKIFSNIMSHVFDKYLPTPFKCDVSVFKSWNG